MATTTDASNASKPSAGMLWGGRVLSTLPCLMLAMSAFMKLSQNQQAVEGFTKAGYSSGALMTIGIVEVLCTILYIVPQTAVLGAILLVGYLGGAVNHHVRMGEPFFAPVLLGICLWLGLWLRDARLRALVPLRSKG